MATPFSQRDGLLHISEMRAIEKIAITKQETDHVIH
jgi:hypothetical protein